MLRIISTETVAPAIRPYALTGIVTLTLVLFLAGAASCQGASPKEVHARALGLARHGQYEEAAAAWRSLLADEETAVSDGQRAVVSVSLARALAKAGKTAEARKALHVALRLRPKAEPVRRLAAQLGPAPQPPTERYASAVDAVARALSVEDLMEGQGAGLFEEATPALREAVAAGWNPGVAHCALATCYLAQDQDLAKARTLLAEAVRVDPDNPSVTHQRGVLALKEGRPADAVTILEGAVKAGNGTRGVLRSLARAYAATSAPKDRVLPAMASLLSLDPSASAWLPDLFTDPSTASAVRSLAGKYRSAEPARASAPVSVSRSSSTAGPPADANRWKPPKPSRPRKTETKPAEKPMPAWKKSTVAYWNVKRLEALQKGKYLYVPKAFRPVAKKKK